MHGHASVGRATRPFLCRLVCLLTAWSLLMGGCGQSQGALLYMLGFGRRKMVKAEFHLTKAPILILVDDASERVDWPPTTKYLTDILGQELIKQDAADKIIPRQTLENLRRSRMDYDKLSCRQIGELVGAEQVLWLEVQNYFADEEFIGPSNAAWFAVTLKVINVQEKENRSRVRLWPNSPDGKYITVSLDGSTVARLKTKDAITQELCRRLASEITKLFCDYRPGDFEPEK